MEDRAFLHLNPRRNRIEIDRLRREANGRRDTETISRFVIHDHEAARAVGHKGHTGGNRHIEWIRREGELCNEPVGDRRVGRIE